MCYDEECEKFIIFNIMRDMAYQNREKRPFGRSGGKKFGGKGAWKSDFKGKEGKDRARSAMHSATCSQCGNECQVPFKPNGRKPVLCSQCFGKTKSTGSSSFGSRGSGERTFRSDRGEGAPSSEQLRAIHEKLDIIIEMLES